MSKHPRSSSHDDTSLQMSIKRMKIEPNDINSIPYVIPSVSISNSVSSRNCPVPTGFYEYDHRIMNELLHTLHDERIDRKHKVCENHLNSGHVSSMDVDTSH